MIDTILIVLLVLYLLGMLGHVALGGAIHVLLVIALVLLVARLLQGRLR